MAASQSTRLAIAFLLGFATPYAWTEASGYWSLYVYTDMIKWLWARFRLKGVWIAHVDSLFVAALVGTAAGILLHAIAQLRWKRACLAFVLGFVAAILSSPLISSEPFDPDLFYAFLSLAIVDMCALLLTVIGVSFVLARSKNLHGA